MRIFIDTTYLIPLFGIETSISLLKEDLIKYFSNNDFTFYYQVVSIIEIKWIILKKSRNDEDLRDELEDAFSDALRFLENTENIIAYPFDSDVINDISYELERFDQPNYFDNLILASAILSSDLLLSEDDKFKQLIEKQKRNKSVFYNTDLRVYSWTNFIKSKF